MPGKLRTESAFADPDDVYDALINAHRDLTDEQSAMLNAKLILILANHIGDLEVIEEALAAARDGV